MIGYNDLDRIKIEKYLEGGVTTRSCYYHYSGGLGDNAKVGLGFNTIDPRAIIGFYRHDACVTHDIKKLKPTMDRTPIEQIMEHSDVQNGEIAFLRYEYDISKIRERNCRRKSYP